MALPYTRALDPADYDAPELQTDVAGLRAFEGIIRSKGVPYRKDHQHREWEYANVLRQLRELITATHAGEVDFKVPSEIKILDTGFGANYFTPMLRDLGYDVEAADSMAYGDCTPWLIDHCHAFGFEIPLHKVPVEKMDGIADQTYDVTLCISTIEHVAEDQFWPAWAELARVTKVGGYIMVTTDYFRDLPAWEASKFKAIQHTPVTPDFLSVMLGRLRTELNLKVVGGDADPTYRGDHVENYSFVNICLQRVE